MSVEVKTEVSQEEINKSLDGLIDDLFTEETSENKKEEVVAKAGDAIHAIIGEPVQSKKDESVKPEETADEVKVREKAEEDEKAGKKRGRPDDLSQMSQRNMATGESKGSYDSSITTPAKNPPNERNIAKGVEITQEDYEILQKAKEAQKEEILQKAKAEQIDLIKSAVTEATTEIKSENAELRKSLAETLEIVKKIGSTPRQRKSISSVQAIEKSFKSDDDNEEKQENFSKAEILDVAEELVKSGKLKDTHVIELEQTGYIYEAPYREALERELKRKN